MNFWVQSNLLSCAWLLGNFSLFSLFPGVRCTLTWLGDGCSDFLLAVYVYVHACVHVAVHEKHLWLLVRTWLLPWPKANRLILQVHLHVAVSVACCYLDLFSANQALYSNQGFVLMHELSVGSDDFLGCFVALNI